MELTKVLEQIRMQRTLIEEAILALERLARGTGKRRGRPPAWIKNAGIEAVGTRRRGRPPGSKNKLKAEAAV